MIIQDIMKVKLVIGDSLIQKINWFKPQAVQQQGESDCPLLTINYIVSAMLILMEYQRADSINLFVTVKSFLYVIEQLIRILCSPLIRPLVIRNCETDPCKRLPVVRYGNLIIQ